MLNSVTEVVEALGGNAAVAAIGGVTSPAVSNWKSRGQIPAELYLVFAARLRELDKEAAPHVFGFAEADTRA